MHQRLTLFPSLALEIALLACALPARAEDDKQADSHLLGSWDVQVTPANVSVCNGPALPTPPAFTELVT